MEKINIKENLPWIIPTTITTLTFIIGNYLVSLLFLIISFIYVMYHFFGDKILNIYNERFKEKINKLRKTKLILIISTLLILILILVFFILYNPKPKIYDLTKGLNLKYYEEFNGKNINNNSKWIYEDNNNEFSTTINGAKTLATSSYIQRGYSMLQDLKKLEGDRVLIGKFNLKEGSKVGIRFMNTDGINSDEIKKLHNNECILQFYKSDNIDEGYGHYITKNNFLRNESTFKNYDFINGNYYILAKVSGRQFSCYFQREGDDMIYPIIENKDIIFENLGGPVMTRFIQEEKSFPELLGFWLYSK